MNDQYQLYTNEVREIAASTPRCKELKTNGYPGVLSFMLLDEADEPARIQVYCNSGTVGVCRVLNNQVREIFQRKCTLRQIKEIFHQPMVLASVDPGIFDDVEQEEGRNPESDRDNVKSLRKDEQLVGLGLDIVSSEFDTLMAHFKSLVRERHREEKYQEEVQYRNQIQQQRNRNPNIPRK